MTTLRRLRSAARKLLSTGWVESAIYPVRRGRFDDMFPAFDNLQSEFLASAQLEEDYQQYTTDVSKDQWAVSLELARVLWHACHRKRPETILDLGTGFTSYVFRLHQKIADPSCLIYSVDSDEQWLEKTRQFLSAKSLSVSNLWLWPEFLKGPRMKFDMIVHDLGGTRLRTEAIKSVLERSGPKTLIFLDDMQRDAYRRHVRKAVAAAEGRVFHLMQQTLDRHGRYAWLVTEVNRGAAACAQLEKNGNPL